jgi:hypothetical protein
VASQLFGGNDLFTTMFTAQMRSGKLQCTGIITSRKRGRRVDRQSPGSSRDPVEPVSMTYTGTSFDYYSGSPILSCGQNWCFHDPSVRLVREQGVDCAVNRVWRPGLPLGALLSSPVSLCVHAVCPRRVPTPLAHDTTRRTCNSEHTQFLAPLKLSRRAPLGVILSLSKFIVVGLRSHPATTFRLPHMSPAPWGHLQGLKDEWTRLQSLAESAGQEARPLRAPHNL